MKEIEKPEIKSRKRNKKKGKLFIILGLIIIVALALLLWFVFNRNPNFTGERIKFEIAGSRSVQSGGFVEYRINYKNEEEVSLKDAELSLIYPDGFSFQSSSEKADNNEGTKWNLKKLSSSEGDEITITGKLYGNPDDMKDITAFLEYRPANFNTGFKEESKISTKILKSDLVISSNFPEIVSREDNLEYSIKVKNEESFELTNLKIKVEYPAGFEFQSADPTPSSDNKVWNFNKIASGEEVEIKIKEKVVGELEEEKSLNVEAGVFDGSGRYYKQRENIFETKIAKIDAKLDYRVAKKKEIVVSLGDLLEFNLNYKNIGTENLPNTKVEVDLNTEFLQEESIVVDEGRYSDGKVIWDDSSLSDFSEVKKKEEGNLKFVAKVKENIDSESTEEPSIVSKAKILSNNEKTGGKLEKESNEIRVKIGTLVELETIGRYYNFDNKKIGTGPIPPKVGETTTYWVYLFITNTTNEVNDGKVEVSLPEGVSWTGKKKVEVGDLSFLGGKLIWNIGKIAADTGGKNPRLEARFELGLTPNEEQVGESLTLVENSVFTGNDLYTEGNIQKERKKITTGLKDDSNIEEGEGVVVGADNE